MRAARIRVFLISVALLSLRWQYAHGAGQDPDCLLHPAQEHVVYCESIPIGSVGLAAQNFTDTALISFESKFFSGLERIKKPHGPEFRKAGHPVLNYPGQFTLAIEPLVLPQVGNSQPAARLPAALLPRRISVRWLDASQRVLAERAQI